MFGSVLVANRGEIARRVIRTARRLGLRTMAVYSDADRDGWHVADADEARHIGGATASESYLNIDAIIRAAKESGAEAIHPGYGFLSERAEFAEACAAAGLIFVGPPPDAIRAMGLKDAAKAIVGKAGVPVVPGYQGDDQSPERLGEEAVRSGFPVLIKAVAGGGGKGMRRVDRAEDFAKALDGAKREAKGAFGDDRVLLETFVARPRHIEVQVFADAHGHAVHLFERDCSLQRRHQKVIEEAPAPGMTEEMRAAMGQAAVKAALAIGYRGAGTVEFIVDSSQGLGAVRFYFMEMNTRLQVEHPVTEAITGLDLVEWQFRVAAGEGLPAQSAISMRGHAIEGRLYAEDPARNFLPSIGELRRLHLPQEMDGVRVDAGVRQGGAVTMFYDPMIAKIIAHGATRDEARRKLAQAFRSIEAVGVRTNAAFVARCLTHPDFATGAIDTGFIDARLADLAPTPGAPAPRLLALAAAGVLLDEDRRQAQVAGSSPWAVNDTFRIGGGGFELVRFDDVKAGGGLVRLERQPGGLVAIIGAETVELSVRLVGDRLVGTAGGEKFDAWLECRDFGITLATGGETITLALVDPLAVDEAASEAGSAIIAPMPGKIVQVNVQAGATVRRGTALIVLEAMKMEHTLSAPADGRIGEVVVQAGDQVSEGAVLARLAQE